VFTATFTFLFFHPKIISRKLHDVTKQGKILFYFAYSPASVYIQYLSGSTTQGNPISGLFCSQKSRYKYENKHFYAVGAKHDILRDITDRNTGMSQLLNQCTLLCDSKQRREKKLDKRVPDLSSAAWLPKAFFFFVTTFRTGFDAYLLLIGIQVQNMSKVSSLSASFDSNLLPFRVLKCIIEEFISQDISIGVVTATDWKPEGLWFDFW